MWTLKRSLTDPVTFRWGSAFEKERESSCTVPVLYLILRFLEDLAGSGGSDPA